MDLSSKKQINFLLKKHRVRPAKGLGQNFLIDRQAVKKIIQTANLAREDTVLEIGPGLGVLTLELAKKAGKVIAVEKDNRMCQALKEILKEQKNVEIINKDILKISNSQFPISNYKVIANLPYYITSPIIRMFLESRKKPAEMILTVQKEVGQRIVAQPPRMNLLSVSVQFYAKPKIFCYISKKSFWPQPKVDSAVIQIKEIKQNNQAGKERFFKIVKAGFSQPRKQLLNNLAKELQLTKTETEKWLAQNKIRPEQRAETLSLEDWRHLSATSRLVLKFPIN